MKPSDFKQIVKDSMREAFYTPERCLDSPLKNADVPENGCWWMRPNLTFFTALRDGITDHETAALIELGRPHPSYPYRELIKKGYVRIVVKNDEKILFFNPPITRPQLQRLIDISIEQNKTLIFDDGRNEKILRARELEINESLLLEELFGQKLYINVGMSKYPALISKNIKSNDGEYRISYFSPGNMRPMGHKSFTKKDLDYILKNKDLTPKIKHYFSYVLFWPENEIFVQFVDGFDKPITPLNEELFGKKMEISYFGNYYQAVLSKNTKPEELPYRISWFGCVGNEQVNAKGHFDITKEEAEYIIEKKEIPLSFYERYGYGPNSFNIQQIYENLLLLEESSRELELWLENKTSINE